MLLRADLSRFVDAQNKDDTYITILKKLQSGESIPWVWCVFPRLKRVKNAENSDRFIAGKREAIQYLAHPVLGTRLREITQTVLALPATDIYDVFDDLDFFDFHSSMTLFSFAEKTLCLETYWKNISLVITASTQSNFCNQDLNGF